MDTQSLIQPVVQLAHKAGTILRNGFGGRISSRYKDGVHNLVTDFDVRVEEFLYAELSNLVPGSCFLGEESGHHDGTGMFEWVVDPLDGTVNFAHGIPIFCVSIAAVYHGSTILGIIHHPILNETFVSIKGGGSFLNGESISVTHTDSLRESFLVTGFPYNVQENPGRCIEQFNNVLRCGLPIRRLGSAALDLAYTAAGRFDGFWEVRLAPWDMAAGVLLVQEAGGTVTHYNNRQFVLGHDSIVATNGRIHNELVSVLEQ